MLVCVTETWWPPWKQGKYTANKNHTIFHHQHTNYTSSWNSGKIQSRQQNVQELKQSLGPLLCTSVVVLLCRCMFPCKISLSSFRNVKILMFFQECTVRGVKTLKKTCHNHTKGRQNALPIRDKTLFRTSTVGVVTHLQTHDTVL